MRIVWKTPVEAHIRGAYHRWLVASWIILMVATGLVFISTAWFAVDRVLNDKHAHLIYLVVAFVIALGAAHFVSWLPPKLYVKYKAKRLVKYRDQLNNLLHNAGTQREPLTEQKMLQLFTAGKVTSGDWIITVANSKVGEIILLLTLRVEEPTDEVIA